MFFGQHLGVRTSLDLVSDNRHKAPSACCLLDVSTQTLIKWMNVYFAFRRSQQANSMRWASTLGCKKWSGNSIYRFRRRRRQFFVSPGQGEQWRHHISDEYLIYQSTITGCLRSCVHPKNRNLTIGSTNTGRWIAGRRPYSAH